MEYHKIGERFEYDGVVLEVVEWTEDSGCHDCYFHGCMCPCPDWCNEETKFILVEQCKTKEMEQKTEIERIQEEVIKIKQKEDFVIEGTDKVFATHKTNIQSDEEIYGSLLDKLFTTYKAKNKDYGSAFSEMFDELGIDYAYGKLREKINRIKVLRNQPNMVENEGLEDALLDTAGYAILTLVELKKKKAMKIPSKIRIGGQDIEVCVVERIEDEKLGQICLAEGKMLIADNFSTRKQSESSKENTFVHEAVHGILDTMGENELSGNEKFVSIFSSFMVDVIEEIIKTNTTKNDKS